MKRRNPFLILLPFFVISALIVGVFYLVSRNNNSSEIQYTPREVLKINVSSVENNPVDILATKLPEFALDLVDEKFKHLWEVKAAERETLIEPSLGIDTDRGPKDIKIATTFDESQKKLLVTPKIENDFKPGFYKLNVRVKTVTGEHIEITQDFTWGVLAVNTNKGIYRKGELVKIGMAVLDDIGHTKCPSLPGEEVNFNTAKVWLTVVSPSGKVQKMSTEDGKIISSKTCRDKSITDEADFLTQAEAYEAGRYTIKMEAENINGKRSIEDHYEVREGSPEFEIERVVFPTRIYPRGDYPVTITVRANQGYSGPITDFVPASFKITKVSKGGKIEQKGDFQTITWNANINKGDIYTLNYQINFPLIAPEFYLIGPLKLENFDEGREWQIASDTLFTKVQEAHNTTTSSSASVTVDSNNGMVATTSGNLLILICYRVTSNSFTTPAGWSSAYNNSSGPRMYMYYRVAPASALTSVTCTVGTNGTLGAQLLEFSGNASSSIRDTRSRRNNINCSGGSMNSASTTPSNIDVLLVTSFSATSTRTANSHSNSFTDSQAGGGGFNASSGASTFDSAWKESINNPPISESETLTYSGNAGTCDNLIVGFNADISMSQGAFRFFDNADSAAPGSPLAAQDTAITLSTSPYNFRLRLLLDVDSPSGNTVGSQTADLMLMYAELTGGTTCATATYVNVDTQANGGPITWNINASSGGSTASIASSGNDPSDGGYTTVYESYYESWDSTDPATDISNDQNALADAQAGLWDFSLRDNTDGTKTRSFCFKIVNGDGSNLDAYQATYPQITTRPVDVVIKSGTRILDGVTIQ